MARKIIGVIVGYIAMAAFVFLSYTLLYLILGAEGAFEPESFHVSFTWIILSIILSFTAALFGGYICMLIAKDKKAPMILAAIVFVLGIIVAIPAFGGYNEANNQIRETSLSNFEAMNEAKQPDFILVLTPIIGAVGVIIGSGFKKIKYPEIEPA